MKEFPIIKQIQNTISVFENGDPKWKVKCLLELSDRCNLLLDTVHCASNLWAIELLSSVLQTMRTFAHFELIQIQENPIRICDELAKTHNRIFNLLRSLK